jgi:hypothetical protein
MKRKYVPYCTDRLLQSSSCSDGPCHAGSGLGAEGVLIMMPHVFPLLGPGCSDQGRSLRPVTKATSELPLIHITDSTLWCAVG